MGIFSKKTEKKETGDAVQDAPTAQSTSKKTAEVKHPTQAPQELSWVLLRPRITEKAVMLGEQNVYTFDVDMRANKRQIKQAIHKAYDVMPVKIAIIRKATRHTTRRNQPMVEKAAKKAMVYLKKGDTIAFA